MNSANKTSVNADITWESKTRTLFVQERPLLHAHLNELRDHEMSAFRPVTGCQLACRHSVQTCHDSLRRSLDELLASADVAFVEHDMGQLRLIEVDNAATVVLDELLNFHKPGNERQY